MPESSSPAPPASLSPRERSFWGRIAHGLVALWGQGKRGWVRFVDSSQHAWWFPVVLAVVLGFDALVVVLPGDLMVGLTVLANPSRWRRVSVVSAVGSTLGSFALYLLVRHFGTHTLEHFSPCGLSLPRWQDAIGFFRRYGLFSLALGSVLPGGSLPPVVMAGVSKSPWLGVLAWLLIGRLARFLLLGFGIREGWAVFQAVKHEAQESRKPPAP